MAFKALLNEGVNFLKRGGSLEKFAKMFGVYKLVKNYKILTYIIPMKAGDFRVADNIEEVSNYVR
jgi:hypothetical protein